MKPILALCVTLMLCSIQSIEAADELPRHEIGKKVIDYFQAKAEKGFGGAVFIARGTEEPLAYGFGWANRELRVAWSPDTVFTVGSITKQFTATAILRLYDEGKLSLDDTLPVWFENVPEDKRNITVHHLLTHSTGIQPGFGGDFTPRATRGWLLERVMDSPLLWGEEGFGVKHEYSNAGYSILGMIVEEVSGLPYEQYLWDTFFEPLGMTDTGYSIPAWDESRLAHGYEDGKDWGVVALKHALPDGPNWNLRGNGGIHSTMRDLHKWHRALIEDRVLKPETRRLMEMPHVAEGPRAKSFYGYGWMSTTTPRGTKYIGHDGGNGIFSADFSRYDEEETLLLFATNTRSSFNDNLMIRFVERLVFPSNE